MKTKNTYTVNKYGKTVKLPPQTNTEGVRKITKILDECKIEYETEYRIDRDGFRRSPFDIAVMKNGIPKLFIEYDGEEHYKCDFFYNTGVRKERCMAHVVKTAIGDAKKTAIAMKCGIPILRINPISDDALRDRIIAWVEIFVNGEDIKSSSELIMINMLDKYQYDFDYVPPSNPTKAERDYINVVLGIQL